MNNILSKKMDLIIAGAQDKFDSIVVRIECPLDTGIKAECHGVKDGVKSNLLIPCGVRDFFLFVNEMRTKRASEKFNLVEIISDASKRLSVRFSFDENIQQRAEENIRES